MGAAAAETQPLAQDVEFTDDDMIVSLVDGREVAVPLVWFPRLANASVKQLEKYELLGDGEGIHWPELARIFHKSTANININNSHI